MSKHSDYVSCQHLHRTRKGGLNSCYDPLSFYKGSRGHPPAVHLESFMKSSTMSLTLVENGHLLWTAIPYNSVFCLPSRSWNHFFQTLVIVEEPNDLTMGSDHPMHLTFAQNLSFLAFSLNLSKQTWFKELLNWYFIAKKHENVVTLYEIWWD